MGSDIPRHRKRKVGRKDFAVEFFDPRSRISAGWAIFRYYPTFKRAEQAALDLKKSHTFINWQFRVREG